MRYRSWISSLLKAVSICVVAALSMNSPTAFAQDGSPGSETAGSAKLIDLTVPVGSQSGRFGIGMGSSWPAYGISGTYRVNELITAEAILGLMGTVTSFAGRGWYRFVQDPAYDVYGYATAGVFRYDYDFFDGFDRVNDTESVFGIGGGVGIELSWAKLLEKPDFLPIYTNIDLGFVHANFEFYDWSGFGFGGGIHYRFGGR